MIKTELLPPHLKESEAATLLIQHGANELPQEKRENFWIKSLKIIKEPMLLLLIVTATLYLFMGSLGEGLMLCLSAFMVVGISFYQECKSENALAALRQLSSPRALVIRDGKEQKISATALVPGDLVVLREGDRVPADGLILLSNNLKIDESLLTGESFPVDKKTAEADGSPTKAFSSTLVIGGDGMFRITATGANTEVGKIGKSLQGIEPEELNLHKEIKQIVKLFAWSGALICSAMILLYGLTHGDWMQALLVGLATQMALLPEEFPVVLSLFLAMGAWRLSKVNILIRQPGSIERLGAVTVLCVDKTGTLTQNRMNVAALHNGSIAAEINIVTTRSLPEDFHAVIEYGVLASHRDAFDPMEKAIRKMAEESEWGKDHLHKDWELVRDYPLSHKLLAMSCVWKSAELDSLLIATKGAPESIIELCHLENSQAEQILIAVKEMANQGLRVLGVAKAQFPKSSTCTTSLPQDQHDFEFKWVGLIGLEDPLRPEVPGAIDLCRKAGIRIIMMTGDHPATALKIAAQAGLNTVHSLTPDSLITGAELSELTDNALLERLKATHIFARVSPEQKLRIVKALKSMGHVVGMTGDGVNDAPSLKWADIGISMGARGTDVAREASDIVLLDDHFASIVKGIERGRLIFNNIRKAMGYIVSIHIPIAGLSIFPVLLNWPLILFPAHIVFLELIIDPACSLMFESLEHEDSAMKSPPRSLKARLFTGKDLFRSFLQGGLVLVLAAAVFQYEITQSHQNADHARTMAFLILALCNLSLIFADMSAGSVNLLKKIFIKRTNRLIVFAVTASLILITQIPAARALFHFAPLSLLEYAAAIGSALFIFLIVSLWNNRTARFKYATE